MKMLQFSTVLILLVVYSFPAFVFANEILLEDTFDGENSGSGKTNYANFRNWVITRGTVDLIGNGYFDFYPGNGLYVDLDGSSNQGGRLESVASFALEPGVYTLSFDVSNNSNSNQNENTVTVTLGDEYSESFTRSGQAEFQTITETITVTTSTSGKLVFDQAGADNDGIIIDNVRLFRQN